VGRDRLHIRRGGDRELVHLLVVRMVLTLRSWLETAILGQPLCEAVRASVIVLVQSSTHLTRLPRNQSKLETTYSLPQKSSRTVRG
jgi:hypothetical protein